MFTLLILADPSFICSAQLSLLLWYQWIILLYCDSPKLINNDGHCPHTLNSSALFPLLIFSSETPLCGLSVPKQII